MKAISVFLAAAVPALAAPSLNRRTNSCPADIDSVLLSLLRPKDAAAASQFCYSYLEPPSLAITSVVVVTTTLPPATISSTYVTTEPVSLTQSVTPGATTILDIESAVTTVSSLAALVDEHATSTVYTTVVSYAKRDLKPTTIPSFLTQFSPSQISSACSRVVTSTATPSASTTLITSTVTATPPPVVATATSTEFDTRTVQLNLSQATVLTTSTSFSTTTVPYSVTWTDTQTTTKTVAVAPTQCPGAYQGYVNFSLTWPENTAGISIQVDSMNACCLACYNTHNCVAWSFIPGQAWPNCEVNYLTASIGDPTAQCPLGMAKVVWNQWIAGTLIAGGGQCSSVSFDYTDMD